MKVLKFGGTSVGTVNSLKNVKAIVEACTEPVIVVVSALGGLTDKLIATAKKAETGDSAFFVDCDEMKARHHAIVDELVPVEKQQLVREQVERLFAMLINLYKGISLVEELSPRSLDKVVSFGERLSSIIVSNIISGAELFDSMRFIKTLKRFGKHVLDDDATQKLIHETFGGRQFEVAVLPGFISTDSDNIITNLGRGGSDYTAAILAAALGANVLEIWTDVDGFMTADPRIVKNARIIQSLSFIEAMELCNFGAKVIYPPTIYPVFHKNIPIYIKNTFNSSAPGTRISDDHNIEQCSTIKGVSTVNDSALITLSGSAITENSSFVAKVLNVMARNNITVFLVSNSHDDSLSFALSKSDLKHACEAIESEFSIRFETGELNALQTDSELSIIGIVSENMNNAADIVSNTYLLLKESGVEVRAISQGGPESSIAFVVPFEQRVDALQLVHDCLFKN